jgi:hypothetical protein
LAQNPVLLEQLALDVAACIDALEIPAFELRLSEWSIIPHAEAMELQWWDSDNDVDNDATSSAQVDESTLSVSQREELRQRRETAELIRREEKKAYEAMRRRREKDGLEPLPKPPSLVQSEHSSRNNIASRKEYREFDGPCVVCLEPDETSRLALQELRSVLQHEVGRRLAKFSPFASTATADPSLPSGRHLWGKFRPLIPIASFPTVTQAIPVAKKLRQLWKPITWEVTDLQILTTLQYELRREELENNSVDDDTRAPMKGLHSNNKFSQFRSSAAQKLSSSHRDENVMGCSALIMLFGEEMEMDHELNNEVANLVAEKGQDGGYARSNHVDTNELEETSSEAPSDETKSSTATTWSADVANLDLSQHGDIRNIEAYLADDGEYDDNDAEDSGTVVVIGRVHYFSGNAREYNGMPAPCVDSISSFSSGSATRTARTTPRSTVISRLLDENETPPGQ